MKTEPRLFLLREERLIQVEIRSLSKSEQQKALQLHEFFFSNEFSQLCGSSQRLDTLKERNIKRLIIEYSDGKKGDVALENVKALDSAEYTAAVEEIIAASEAALAPIGVIGKAKLSSFFQPIHWVAVLTDTAKKYSEIVTRIAEAFQEQIEEQKKRAMEAYDAEIEKNALLAGQRRTREIHLIASGLHPCFPQT